MDTGVTFALSVGDKISYRCAGFQIGSRGIEASWAGGEDGREVIDRFLPTVEMLLSLDGAFYLVIIKENKPGMVNLRNSLIL